MGNSYAGHTRGLIFSVGYKSTSFIRDIIVNAGFFVPGGAYA